MRTDGLFAGALFSGALFASALFGATESQAEPVASRAGGGGGGFLAVDTRLADEFERISVENAIALKAPFKTNKLATAVSVALQDDDAALKVALETARQESLAAESAKLQEAEAAKLAEDAKQASIVNYNALMLALILMDDE